MQPTNEQVCENESNFIVEDAEVQELNDIPIPSTSQSYVEPIENGDNISRPEKRKRNTEKWPTKKEKQHEEWVTLFKKGSEEQKKLFEVINKVQEDDPIDTFFKSMASTVKTFSPSLKIRAKKEIFNIVNNLEFENHNINDSTSRNALIYSSSPSLSTQSSQSGFTMYNVPIPVEVSPEMTNNGNNYQISGQNWMQYGEDYNE